MPLGDGTRESHSSVAALAKLCSLSTACVAFTTVGTLVTQLPGNATWPDIAPGAGRPCDGVYLRSAVLGKAGHTTRRVPIVLTANAIRSACHSHLPFIMEIRAIYACMCLIL